VLSGPHWFVMIMMSLKSVALTDFLLQTLVQPIVRQFESVGNNKFKKVGGVLVFHQGTSINDVRF